MRAILLVSIVAICMPAVAAETPWQEVAPDTRARLISSDVLRTDGTTMIGLELDMPQASNTYWRVPGETGIPTTLDFSGSRAISGHEVLWPYPTLETVTGFVDYVYRGPTVLPVELRVDGDSAQAEVAVLMGICSDICVPVSAKFSLPLAFGQPDRAQGLRIAQAIAETPEAWSDREDPVGAVAFDGESRLLSVALTNPEVDPMSLIADLGSGSQLFGAPQKSPDGNIVVFPLLGGNAGHVPEGPVRLTFMTAMGPFSIERPISSSGSTAAAD